MDLELERWAHLQRPRRLVMVLASPRMTTHPLHQTAADGATFSTLELIPTPSQPGQHHDDGKGDQPTHGDNGLREQSKNKAAGAQSSSIVNETGGDAVQAGLNRLNALYSGQRSAVATSLLRSEDDGFSADRPGQD